MKMLEDLELKNLFLCFDTLYLFFKLSIHCSLDSINSIPSWYPTRKESL